MQAEYRFQASAEWTSGRRGQVSGATAPRLEFSAPPEFQGQAGIWSPEDFFLAAIVTCFITTFRAIAEFSKFPFQGLRATAEGVLQKGDGGYKFTEVHLRPVLTVEQEDDRERAQRLLEKAERACLISRSIQSKIVFEPKVETRSFAPAN